MPINVIGIITLAVALLNIVLGFIVLIKNPKNSNNLVYSTSVCSIALWIIFTYLYNNPTILSPEIWLKIVYLASYGMLISQTIFAFIFPRRLKDDFIYYAVPIFLTVLPSIYVLLIQDSVVLFAVNYPQRFLSIAEMGSGYLIYTIPNTLGILLLAIYFLKKSRKFVGYEKAQIQFYITGALMMMLPIIVIDYFIPLISGDTSLFVYGPLFVIPFSISVAYSILEDRFVNIKGTLKKAMTFSSRLILIISLLVIFLTLYKKGLFPRESFLINIALYSIGAMITFYIEEKVMVFLLGRVFKDRENMEKILDDFLEVANMELSLERIFINVDRTIEKVFKIENVGLLLYNRNNYTISKSFLQDFPNLGLDVFMSIMKYWEEIVPDRILVVDEVKRATILNRKELPGPLSRVLGTLEKYSVSVILPFSSRTNLDGIIILGYRFDRYPLSIEDIEVMKKLTQNIGVSVGRALLYEEVQTFNQTLQQKVSEQTKELQQKVLELQEARRKERDMIDIMGHELRTPATIVKLNVELLEKYIDSNPEEFRKYVDRIKGAIENEIKLINTLLSSAKLEGNKIEIKEEKVDIVGEIEMAIHGHESDSEDKELVLINKVKDGTPEVYSDKARTVEILNNLIDNAIKYTDNGSVTIETDFDDEYVKVSVIDTGKGIPENEISKLGQKFHRIDNYLESSQSLDIVRPGGTGLGLYVTFRLVELMGGKIWVESKLGEGSKFIFTLPRYRGQKSEPNGSNNMFERLGLSRSN